MLTKNDRVVAKDETPDFYSEQEPKVVNKKPSPPASHPAPVAASQPTTDKDDKK